MNKIVILKQQVGTEEEKRHDSFIFDSNLYETKEIQFAKIMWSKLVKKLYGYDYVYLRDWYDYTEFYHMDNYEGEGVYRQGRCVMSVSDLKNGYNMIRIGDNLYYIREVE